MKYSLNCIFLILVIVLSVGAVNATYISDAEIYVVNADNITRQFDFNYNSYYFDPGMDSFVTLHSIVPEIPQLNRILLYNRDGTTFWSTSQDRPLFEVVPGFGLCPSLCFVKFRSDGSIALGA